jgi:rhodanese-related sulfurtransferase
MDRFQGQTQAADTAVGMSASEILELAHVRRTELGLDYAGAVTPPEAWQLLQEGAAALIDVRTAPEFQFVGRVPGSDNIEWHGKDEKPRARFLAILGTAIDRDETVLLICRSAVRSHAAASAAAAAGFTRVYNVLEGFEGQIDAARHRGNINGWRHAGLPWEQD